MERTYCFETLLGDVSKDTISQKQKPALQSRESSEEVEVAESSSGKLDWLPKVAAQFTNAIEKLSLG